MSRKGKRKMIMMVTLPVLLVTLALGGALLFTSGERREAKNLPIKSVDFKQLHDGTYVGEYEGGMYKWRANKIQVTISKRKVTDIKLLEHKEKNSSEITNTLFNRVIQSQSLQVDTISGATLTSKAYLKGIENALVEAQEK